MSIAIKVPTMGESVTEATIARWLKHEGDAVAQDEPLVELETDKVNIEVPSPAAGVLEHIEVKEGGTVNVGTVLGQVKEGQAGAKPTAAPAKVAAPKAAAAPPPKAVKAEPPKEAPKPAPAAQAAPKADVPPPPPSVRRIAEEEKLDTSSIEGTGKHGQLTKGDALTALELRKVERPVARPVASQPSGDRTRNEREERVPMSRLRKTIALRLKESQEIAAQLTTFNEAELPQH